MSKKKWKDGTIKEITKEAYLEKLKGHTENKDNMNIKSVEGGAHGKRD